jgi:hypothetical protein
MYIPPPQAVLCAPKNRVAIGENDSGEPGNEREKKEIEREASSGYNKPLKTAKRDNRIGYQGGGKGRN